jgi:deazaflavin-dependent oxidoreductase (nitroreductase family)
VPIPKFVARFNRRVFNPAELKRGVRPVLTHVGRSSGKTYRTPLDAHVVHGGFIFIIMYGSDSDWVQNVLASGTAAVAVDGEQFDLESPKLISKQEAWQLLSDKTKEPPNFLKVTEYLQMDLVAS